jgi:hypothetical protein
MYNSKFKQISRPNVQSMPMNTSGAFNNSNTKFPGAFTQPTDRAKSSNPLANIQQRNTGELQDSLKNNTFKLDPNAPTVPGGISNPFGPTQADKELTEQSDYLKEQVFKQWPAMQKMLLAQNNTSARGNLAQMSMHNMGAGQGAWLGSKDYNQAQGAQKMTDAYAGLNKQWSDMAAQLARQKLEGEKNLTLSNLDMLFGLGG